MGLTAIPMGFYTHSNQKDLSSVKNLVLLWHFVGLYDLLSAFGMAGGCYFGFVSFGHSLGYLCFHPITLICYFQVFFLKLRGKRERERKKEKKEKLFYFILFFLILPSLLIRRWHGRLVFTQCISSNSMPLLKHKKKGEHKTNSNKIKYHR